MAITIAIALLLLAAVGDSSLYDPHLPTEGHASFFEGWYTRIVAADGNSSFAVLFGLVRSSAARAPLPPAPRAVITIAYQDSSGPTTSLQVFTEFPDPSAITITRNGSAVTSNPDYTTPPDFRWDAGQFGYQETRDNVTTMNFTVARGSVRFFAETISVVPWTAGASGLGPAGALDALPLPLHWFVYSLASHVAAYSFVSSGGEKSGVDGRAHMEKNWGGEFPDKWMWAQACGGGEDAAFAFSGGDLMLWGKELTMNTSHLAGYRSANKRVSWSFTPADSRMTASIDACKGLFSFDLRHIISGRRLNVSISAPALSLRSCLWGPSRSGFAPMSTESFLAVIEITAFARKLTREDVVDHVVLRNAAVEFGGAYRCMRPDPCLQPRE